MIFWGFSFVGTKISLTGGINPITLVLTRLIISSIFMFGLTLSLNTLQIVNSKDFKWFLLLAFFEPFCYFLGETYGMNYIPSTLGAVLIATIPLFVPMAALLVYKEKASLLNIIGIVISIAGVIMVIANKNFTFDTSLKGVILLMIAVFSAVGYTIVLRHLAQKYSAVTIIAWQNLLGVMAFLPLFFIIDINTFNVTLFNSKIILTIVALGIFPSSLSYVFYTIAVKELGINKSTVFTNLIPVLTAIFAYFMMNEEISFVKITGITIVIFALFISQLKKLF